MAEKNVSFTEHMWNFNHYGITLAGLILGNELGFFEVLNDAKEPLTSHEIAERSDCKERYVREWLGTATAAEVVNITDQSGTPVYNISEEHYNIVKKAILVGEGLSTVLGRLDAIKACFKRQGPMGDPDAFDGDFCEYWRSVRREMANKDIFEDVFPKIEKIRSLHDMLTDGCKVLDIGCACGELTMAFAKRYPNAHFTGVDVSDQSLAKAKASLKGETNITFQHSDQGELLKGSKEEFDVVMLLQVLHNLPDTMKMIRDVSRVSKPGAKLILIEANVHSDHADNVGDMNAAFIYTISQFFCLPFSMSAAPHTGYGACWGHEAMVKAISESFTFDQELQIDGFEFLFALQRKDYNSFESIL